MATPIQPTREQEGQLYTQDGLRLFLRSWRVPNPKGAIALVHGLGEHSRRYWHVASVLNAQRYNVHALDLRGHGRSPGERVFVRDFAEYLLDVDALLEFVRQEEGTRPIFLLGHSMGGAISTLFTIRRDPSIQGLVLSSPLVKPGADATPFAIWIARTLGSYAPRTPVQTLDANSISRDPNVVANYVCDPFVYHGPIRAGFGHAMIQALQEIETRMSEIHLPLLILQGGADTLVHPDGSKLLIERAHTQDKTLITYPSLYHEVFNEPEKQRVFHDLLSWLDKQLS